MKNLPELIVPFKRPVYERVVKEFSRLVGEWPMQPEMQKPYRPNVGIALFNASGQGPDRAALPGRRAGNHSAGP